MILCKAEKDNQVIERKAMKTLEFQTKNPTEKKIKS